MTGAVLGIDLGGTKTAVCLADPQGKIHQTRRLPTRVEEGPVALTLTWAKHQGPPGEVEWVRHPSTPIPEPEPEPEPPDTRAGGPDGGDDDDEPPPPEVITLEEGSGTALVQARFSSPGVYLLRVRADQFGSARDSGAGGQCCWTNGYVSVKVTR